MLSLQSQKNIVATKDVRGTVTANLYDVTIKEALDAILRSNGYDYREKGNFIYVYTAKELADMEKAAMVRKTEIFRLYYTPVANAANLIKPVLSEGAQVALTAPAQTGIESEGKDAGGNSHATEDLLVVSDYPDRLDQVRAILKEVDRRPVQILVEATILQAQINENNDLGDQLHRPGRRQLLRALGHRHVHPGCSGRQRQLQQRRFGRGAQWHHHQRPHCQRHQP